MVGGAASRDANKAGRAIILAGSALVLTACVSEQDIAARSLVAPDSPVARKIAEVRSAPAAYPTFADVPARPTDLPTSEAWRRAVAALESSRGELVSASGPDPVLADTDAFIRDAQARTAGEPAPQDNTAAAEAFLREGRERATPPPAPR